MDPLVHTVLSAAEQGHKQRLSSLLRENPAMAEACDEEGSTPLMYAAANGRENVLYLLVQQNQVNINAQNLYGWTALMQAACYGHLMCVMQLVQFKADIHLVNSWGASALVGAAQGGFDTVVQFLLDKGACVNVAEEVTSLTPLMAAAQCGHLDIVDKLIKAGCNVNAVLKATRWSALMLAAVNNQREIMTLLLQHGARKELQDISKKTAVQLASALGHRDAVLVLDGEKIDAVSDADFFEAVKAGQAERVEAMLRECPALAKAKTKDGFTPLMRAANKGHVKVCGILLRAGCPVNAKDAVNGWTALMQATHQRRYEVAKLLGCHGAAVNLRGKSGSTAFDIANMLGDIEMIRIVANISVERIRKTSAPPPNTDIPSLDVSSSTTPPQDSATPTPDSPIPVVTTRRKSLIPTSGPLRLKSLPPTKPLDTSELIRKLQMAYADPISPTSTPTTKAAISSIQDSPNAIPRFPSPRLRRPVSVPLSSLNSSTETCSSVSPGDSANTIQLDNRALSLERPEPLKSASYLTSHHSQPMEEGGETKILSRSNPPSNEVGSGKHAGRGGGSGVQPVRVATNARHPLFRPDTLGSKLDARPGRGGGVKELAPFLPSRIPPTIAVAGRPKEIVPKWQILSGQNSLEAEKMQLKHSPLRRRSFTVPAKPKPALQTTLEQSFLGEYYKLFAEQELDLCSFLTLSESDLIDLCITNSNDRQRLLTLIKRLRNRNRTNSPMEQNGARSTLASPVFLFQ